MALKLKYDFTKPIWDDADDQIDAQKGPSLDVVRASTANVTDYFNVIKTVKANEPRFTGGRRVENLVTRSQDITTGWTELFASSTADATTDPDGGSTADKLLETTDTNVHRSTAPSITPKVAAQYTSSIYVKGGLGRDFFALQTDFGGVNTTRFFNISTGVTGTNSGAAQDAYGIEDAGNGWYRCWTTITAISTTASSIRANIASADGTSSYAGDITRGLYFWGAQVENVSGQDDPSPSEYIATTTAAVSKWYATRRPASPTTNLCLQSNGLDTTWTNSSSIEAQGATDPDGGSTAWTVTDDSSTGTGTVSVREAITLLADTRYVFSAYLKKDQLDWARISFAAFTGATAYAYFDLTNGAVGADLGANNDSVGITSIGSGWYRCWVTAKLASDASGRIDIIAANANGDFGVDLDGTSSIQVYGAQIERAGHGINSVPSSYIPTTTVAVEDATATNSLDGAAITPTGLLIEEARTNLMFYSQEFENALWVSQEVTEAANTETAPDGTVTADTITLTVGSVNPHNLYRAMSVTADLVYTVSVYAKAGTHDYVSINFATTNDGCHAHFKISTQTVGTAAALAAGTYVGSGIEDVGNGWVRCWLTGSSTATTVYPSVNFPEDETPATIDAFGRSDWSAAGTETVHIWGYQLEAGAFPTSYIPTVAASVTRSADAIETTDVSWLNANAGTLYVKETLHGTTTQDGVFLNDNTNDNLIGPHHAVGDVTFLVRVSDTNQANIIAGTLTLDTELQVAGAWSANDFAVSLDGASVVTDSAGTIPTVTQFTLASPPAYNNNLHKIHISEIRYYNERLDNTALENMSNGIFPALGSGGAALFWWW